MLNYPNIDPIALSIGPVNIYWYGISYIVGIFGAWAVLRLRIKNGKTPVVYSNDDIADIAFYCTLGIIIGGRLGWVLFYNFSYYLEHMLDIFKLHQGGMSFHGGLLGGILAILCFARKKTTSFFRITDMLAPVTPIALGCGRIGNFINGELWGRPSDLPWAMVFPHPSAGNIARHPSQLYEFLLEGCLLFIILWLYTLRPRPVKAASGVFLLGYGIMRFAVEFVRQPDQHIGYILFDWLTLGQLLSVPMVILGIWLIASADKIDKRVA